MKEINTQESNLFSRNIVELKLISDRIAEGKGETAGIFSNTYQILYILDRKETVTPKELIAELNIAKSNLAILAKKMIKDGQIESHKDKYNKREIYSERTDNNGKILYRGYHPRHTPHQRLCRELPQQEKHGVHRRQGHHGQAPGYSH